MSTHEVIEDPAEKQSANPAKGSQQQMKPGRPIKSESGSQIHSPSSTQEQIINSVLEEDKTSSVEESWLPPELESLEQPALREMRSQQQLKQDFKQNQKIISSLTVNIDDLFKKISSLTEQISSQMENQPFNRANSRENSAPSAIKLLQQKYRSLPIIPIISETPEVPLFQIFQGEELEESGINMKLFETGKSLGHGKFGEVLECRHKQTGALFALKKIFKSTIEDYDMKDQILIEIEACKRMNHPNVIKSFAAFTDEFHIFLLSECAKGEKLTTKFGSPEGEVSRIILQVLDALKHIHAQNVAHRDLKPENIIIGSDMVKICDFGWADLLDQSLQMNIVCGTLDYVCPQMVAKQPYSKEVDLWSVGVLTYQLIYGIAPFKGENKADTFNKVQKMQVQFVQDRKVSEKCVDFIRRLLQPEEKRMRLEQCLLHPFIADSDLSNPQLQELLELDTLFK